MLQDRQARRRHQSVRDGRPVSILSRGSKGRKSIWFSKRGVSERANISALVSTRLPEIKDLDETAEKVEVATALR